MSTRSLGFGVVLRARGLIRPGNGGHPRLLPLLVALVLAASAWPQCLAAENGDAPPAAAAAEQKGADDVLRSYLQLQEQLHSVQLTIEKDRQENAAAADRANEQLAERLRTIEAALAAQRARELEAMQSSNRVMLTVAGSFAAIGLLAVVCMTWFQWRTIGRLAEISAGFQSSRLLGAGQLAPDDGHLLAAGPASQTNSRLLGNLERLERRILELEHTTQSPSPALAAAAAGNNGNSASTPDAPPAGRAALLLAKGQSLLNMDRAEEALAAFDEALASEPHIPEGLLKRAAALERLGQVTQALESCDRAIAEDKSMTMAYLQKGGIYSRMERYNDALECYEAALRTKS